MCFEGTGVSDMSVAAERASTPHREEEEAKKRRKKKKKKKRKRRRVVGLVRLKGTPPPVLRCLQKGGPIHTESPQTRRALAEYDGNTIGIDRMPAQRVQASVTVVSENCGGDLRKMVE